MRVCIFQRYRRRAAREFIRSSYTLAGVVVWAVGRMCVWMGRAELWVRAVWSVYASASGPAHTILLALVLCKLDCLLRRFLLSPAQLALRRAPQCIAESEGNGRAILVEAVWSANRNHRCVCRE